MYGTSGRRLQRLCAQRWLSSQLAVTAMKAEVLPVWDVLEAISIEKDDQQAFGLLKGTRKKSFVFVLYLLDTVLPYLSALSKIFQAKTLNFAHMQHALDMCRDQIADADRNHNPRKNLQEDWQLRFQLILGNWTTDDSNSMDCMTTTYCEALLKSISHRFPEPEILTAFSVFDPNRIPKQRDDRRSYADADLDLLCSKFNIQDPGKLHTDWASFAEKLLYVQLENSESIKCAGNVCTMILREPVYEQMWPKIVYLAKIAMTLPLTSVDNERGFSTMKLTKTPHRNRLLDETLSALMNVTINGPTELSKEDALQIASVWLEKKPRRKVIERGRNNLAKLDQARMERKRNAEKKQGHQSVGEDDHSESDYDEKVDDLNLEDVADVALAALDFDLERFLY